MSEREGFTNSKPRYATEEELKAPWSGKRDGSQFRCYLCGHRFKLGDYWRWIYSGGKTFISPNTGKESGMTNLMVCQSCDADNETVLNKWAAMHVEAYTKFWSFIG